jgi:hypothetical protein
MDTTYSLKLPPKNYRRIIEELSVVIPDPVLKLKFLQQAINEHQKISAPYKLYPPLAGIAFRKKLLDKAETIWPGSKKAEKNLIRNGVISTPYSKLLWLYKLRYAIGSAILMFFILGVGTAVSPLMGSFNLGARIHLNSQRTETTNTKIIIRKPIFYSQRPKSGDSLNLSVVKPVDYQNGDDQISKYLNDPILLALSSQKAINSRSDHIIQKPLLSSLPPTGGNHSPPSIAKPAKHHNELGLDRKFFQNPILMALASQPIINSSSASSFQKPILSSQMSVSGNYQPSPTAKPAKSHNGPNRVPKYFQKPILIARNSPQIKRSKSNRITQKPLLTHQTTKTENHSPSPLVKPAKYHKKPLQIPKYLNDPIWLVEKTSDREIYSNRLQIITTYTISNLPREYYRFPKNSDRWPPNSKTTDKISGIVYHASESDLYPFMPEMNHSILKYSKRLIKYLLRKKSYHFFIDRFGRVYRLVQEDHAAFHAGNSIWADDEEIYLNLNHAFIGICFEGNDFEETKKRNQKKGQSTKLKSSLLKPTGISAFNEAQLRSGKELTDWLRAKYKIPQHNCVPHALISVNPDRRLIGYHLDLSRGFPFARFGLSDKYQEPLPSIVEFGFLYDSYFEKIFNGKLWNGIRFSEKILQHKARNSGMSFADYRRSLHQRFSRYAEWKKKMLEKTMGKEDRLNLGKR